MPVYVKVGGAIKEVGPIHRRVSGALKEVDVAHIRVGSALKEFYQNAPDPTVSFTANRQEQLNPPSGTWTVTNVPIGTPAADRTVIVAVNSGNPGRYVETLTVGGVNLPRIAGGNNGLFDRFPISFFAGLVPSGETANIQAQLLSSITDSWGCAVWAAYGVQSTTPRAIAKSDSAGGGSLNANVASGGFVLAYALFGASENPGTASWSGLTKEFEVNQRTNAVDKVNYDHSAAWASGLPGATPRAMSLTVSPAPAVTQAVLVSMK